MRLRPSYAHSETQITALASGIEERAQQRDRKEEEKKQEAVRRIERSQRHGRCGYKKNGVTESKESLEAWFAQHDDTAIRRNARDQLGSPKPMNGNKLTSMLLGILAQWVSLRL